MRTARSGRAQVAAAVFAGGCAGALARALLVEAVPPQAAEWPWATFSANLAGALLLGLLLGRTPPATRAGELRRPLLGTGLCGALTTFSTMQLELLVMLDAARWGLATGYAGASIACGVALVAAAGAIGRPRGPLP